MSDKSTGYNERAWEIDVISEICSYVGSKKLSITKASGEHTIKSSSTSKFPDVLLMGGVDGSIVLQGWELKMPDTSIYDDDPLKRAEEKARLMSLDSFVVWNAAEAALFKENENNEFVEIQHWSDSYHRINSREDVRIHEGVWKRMLYKIIDYVEALLQGSEIRGIPAYETVNGSLYGRYIKELSPHVQSEIKEQVRKNREFKAGLDYWWRYSKEQYSPNSKGKNDEYDMYETLSKLTIVGWINRFLFAHYLKKFNIDARRVDNITDDTSIDDAFSIFEKISQGSGYSMIFNRGLCDECINEHTWKSLVELNLYLKTVSVGIAHEDLQSLLLNVVSISRRETAGQYCTPQQLARLLVELAVNDLECTIYDPCCGTGTIIREAQTLKRECGSYDSQSVWASDKFTYPLNVATVSLTNPDNPSDIIQLFEADVFDMHPGKEVLISNSKGEKVPRIFEPVDVVVSNLPFLRFENISKSNSNLKSELKDKRHDLYADITLYLFHLIGKEGRIGLILSNSWLCTKWGEEFRDKVLSQYTVERVITSQAGRWFKDVDVVATILILKKGKSQGAGAVQYVTTCKPVEEWNCDLLDEMVIDIRVKNTKSRLVHVHEYTSQEIETARKCGLGLMAAFTDMSWHSRLIGKMVQVSSLFEIARGSRRGWDDLFYPEEGNEIEAEFLKPVIKTAKGHTRLMIEPDGVAFCCSMGISDLEEKGFKEARKWIAKFEKTVNENGEPLSQVLKTSKLKWYEMASSEVADFVIQINPDTRPCVFRCKEKTFVNQRLIRLNANEGTDVELLHALMNSTLGLLMIESQGFGRGLSVLDLSSDRMKSAYMVLDPECVKDRRGEILDAFRLLLNRSIKELPEELKMDDRIAFDDVLLSAYGLSDIREQIAGTLLDIYHIRKSARVEK